MASRVIYTEFAEQRLEEGAIEVVMNDDLTVVIPPVECWPDEAFTVKGANMTDVAIKVYQLLLGDETWDAFKAAGGTASMLDKIVEQMAGAGKTGSSKRAK